MEPVIPGPDRGRGLESYKPQPSRQTPHHVGMGGVENNPRRGCRGAEYNPVLTCR